MSEPREQLVDHPYEEPRDDLERTVARAVADVLDIDRIGRTDSFYDFGGTSLAAIKICARIEHECGRRAEPAWLFRNDVVADFARQVGSGAELEVEA